MRKPANKYATATKPAYENETGLPVGYYLPADYSGASPYPGTPLCANNINAVNGELCNLITYLGGTVDNTDTSDAQIVTLLGAKLLTPCLVRATANSGTVIQTITSGTALVLRFPAEAFDTLNSASDAVGGWSFVPPRDGYYDVSLQVAIHPSITGMSGHSANITLACAIRNGSTNIHSTTNCSTATAGADIEYQVISTRFSTLVYLTTSMTINVVALAIISDPDETRDWIIGGDAISFGFGTTITIAERKI